jgi:sphingomyelin phosphodiesterase acid-like 3
MIREKFMALNYIYIGILWVTMFSPALSFSAPLVTNQDNFLVISDIHLNQDIPTMMDITPSKSTVLNDLDMNTFKMMLAQISQHINAKLIPNPRFIIVLGDLVGHIRVTADSAVQNEAIVFKLLKATFPKTPIFYSYGNNDGLHVDYGSFSNPYQSGKLKSPFDVAVQQAGWEDGFLSTGVQCNNKQTQFPCLIDENKVDGYYSAYISPKLRIISLNTIMFSPKRVDASELDVTNQLNWLNTQLSIVRNQNESVLITMHIPPGNNVYNHGGFWTNDAQQQFLKLIEKYQHEIIGLIAGHTHAEELKIIQNHDNQPIAGVYFVAALSTAHGNSPSLKTFYYSNNLNHWQLDNYSTWYFNMSNAKLVLSSLYDFMSYYCDSNKTNMGQCLNLISADKMRQYFSAGNPNNKGMFEYPADVMITR